MSVKLVKKAYGIKYIFREKSKENANTDKKANETLAFLHKMDAERKQNYFRKRY